MRRLMWLMLGVAVGIAAYAFMGGENEAPAPEPPRPPRVATVPTVPAPQPVREVLDPDNPADAAVIDAAATVDQLKREQDENTLMQESKVGPADDAP